MIDLNSVVQAISERGLKLIRTADSLRIEGDCPPELADGIKLHQASLLPFAAAAPEVKAADDSNRIRQQLEDHAEAIVKRYAPRLMDERLAKAVDTQNPDTVADEIVRIIEQADAVEWACLLFPQAMETEAKHAVESGATGIGESLPDDDIPF